MKNILIRNINVKRIWITCALLMLPILISHPGNAKAVKKVTRKQNITMKKLTPALEQKISATTPAESPTSDLNLIHPATRLSTARLPQGYTFDGTYYYYLSQLASFGSHQNDLRLTRVRYEGNGTYTESYMTLKQFGHGTNLDCVTRNGVTWLWTGSDPSGSAGATTTISCFTFQAGKTLRKHAAISYRIPIKGKKNRYGTNCYPAVNQNGTQLAVRFTNNGGQQFQFYNLTDGTKIEPQSPQKTLRLKNTAGVFQGFDISGTTVYTLEGTARKSEMKELGKASAYDPIRIRSYNYTTKKSTVQTIKGAVTLSHREPEGIQVDEAGKAIIMIASHYKEKYTCANVYGVK